jgi:hypothetical protein
MNRYQCYCSLDELNDDAEGASGLSISVLKRFILPASEYLSKEIGAFQPVAETLKLAARGQVMWTPALLRLSGDLTSEGVTVSQANVVLRSTAGNDQAFWHNGPYLRIDALDDYDITWSEKVNGVEVPGVWGLYELAESLGATLAAEQGVSAETVTVADGSALSPGMLLKIGDEWQSVDDYGAITPNLTTLASALDASSEVVALTSGAAVKIGEVAKIEFEQVKVLDIQSNSAFVIRGWNKTKKVAHNSGAAVGAFRSYYVTRAVNGSVAATHASATAIARMVTPSDINYLTRQIATLMMKKSQGGYAGRLGNAESGESFYMHEFPRDAIARVKSNYYIPAAR